MQSHCEPSVQPAAARLSKLSACARRAQAGYSSLKSRKLAARYGAGLVEQMLMAILSFGVVMVCGRVMDPSSFATFVLIMVPLTLAFNLASSLISLPVMVLLPKRYLPTASQYLRHLEIGNTLVCILVGLPSMAILELIDHRITWLHSLCGVLYLIGWSSYDLRRKAAYACRKPNRLLISTGIVVALCGIGLALGHWYPLNAWNVFLLLTVVNGIGCLSYELLAAGERTASGGLTFPTVMRDHWSFGRSLFSGVLLYWMAFQGYFAVGAHVLSDVELGGARTAQNLTGLLTLCLLIFENYATPVYAAVAAERGAKRLHEYVSGQVKTFGPLFTAAVVVAAVISYPAHHFIYRHQYSAYSYLTIGFCLHQFLLGWNRPYSLGLRAVEANGYIFWANMAGALLMVVFAFPLVHFCGPLGVAVGFCLSTLASLMILFRGFQKVTVGALALQPGAQEEVL